MLTYKNSVCEVCIIWRKPTETLKILLPIAEFEDWEASNGHTKDKTRLFHGPWHNAVGEHICAQPFKMWNRLRFHTFLQVSQIFQRRKSDANKQDFWKWLNLTSQAQSTPKTTGILTKVFCNSGSNLVILARRGDELSHGQTQNGVNFDFQVKFDLEGQGQWPPKAIGTLTKVFYTYGLNLVILARTGDELSRGQACGYRTHRRTHRQTDGSNDNTRRPKLASGKNEHCYEYCLSTCYLNRMTRFFRVNFARILALQFARIQIRIISNSFLFRSYFSKHWVHAFPESVTPTRICHKGVVVAKHWKVSTTHSLYPSYSKFAYQFGFLMCQISRKLYKI